MPINTQIIIIIKSVYSTFHGCKDSSKPKTIAFLFKFFFTIYYLHLYLYYTIGARHPMRVVMGHIITLPITLSNSSRIPLWNTLQLIPYSIRNMHLELFLARAASLTHSVGGWRDPTPPAPKKTCIPADYDSSSLISCPHYVIFW